MSISYVNSGLTSKSSSMREAYRFLSELIKREKLGVLFAGEEGSGRTFLARWAHSQTSDGSFVQVDCRPSYGELESEIFDHDGKLVRANRGTLFLYEATNLPEELQQRVAAAVRDRRFTSSDTHKEISIETRLSGAASEGRLQADLLQLMYTLNLPPLRARTEDIPALAEEFLQLACSQYHKSLRIGQDAMREFMRYNWPGNVLELKNVISTAVIRFGSTSDTPYRLTEEDASLLIRGYGLPSRVVDFLYAHAKLNGLNKLRDEVERIMIIKALEETGGNQRRTANLLGHKRTTLIEAMRRFNINIQTGKPQIQD